MPDETSNNAMVHRPSQAEVNYTLTHLKTMDGPQCSNCRWFIKEVDGGPSCHLIELGPTDISPAGVCQRHEDSPVKEVAPEAVTVEPEPEVPQFVEDRAEDVREMIERVNERTVQLAAAANELVKHQTSVWERSKAQIDNTFARLLGHKEDTELTEFKVHKNSFIITWSNNFKDRDDEIFTAKAIDRYIARVDMGIVPPPEVWVWHIGKAVRIGQASIVARHGHFAFTVGEFDADAKAQRARDYYARNAKRTSVSHGFTFRKDKFDGQHYHEFNTFEISLLPRGKEANRFTTLEGVKDMAVTPEKLKYLEDVFGKETVDGMLADLEERGKALEEIGVAYKDFADVDAAPIETEAAKEAVEVANKDFAQLVVDLVGDNAAVLKQTAEIMKAVSAYKASTDATIAAQNATIAALNERLDDRPRSASKDAATIIENDALSAEMKKNLTEYEEFLPGIILKKIPGE